MIWTYFNQRIREIRHREGWLGLLCSPGAGLRLSPHWDSQELWAVSLWVPQAMGLLLCLRRELPADWQKWDSMLSLCFPAEAGFSCRTEKIRSLLLRERLEITPKGRGEEKGICKASLKLGNHLPLLVWLSGSAGSVLAPLARTGHRQQQSTQKLKCLTQFLYSWEIHLLSRISLTLATPGISWGQHFPWSFGIWVPSGARKCRIMWSIKNRNVLRRQLLLAASSCSLLLFHHLFPPGPKGCGSI